MIRVGVVSDTPEWEAERRNSIGASEVAAVMGLSPYATRLDVYKQKKGIDRYFDPVLAMIGHRSEAIMHEWLEKHSGLDLGPIGPGFMARMDDRPWLHASFDRVAGDVPVQMKTASAYSGHAWDEGIPTDIRIQVQAEMAVFDAPRALVVVWIGGREFRTYWEPRDDRFVQEHMLPAVDAFWHDHVAAGLAPEPTTVAELNEIPVEPGKAVEADDTVLEAIDRRAVLLSDVQSMQEEADALKVAIGQWMGDADTITKDGRNVLTFRYAKGRAHFDAAALKRDHPDLAAQYTVQGAPYRVMRTTKPKEKK